MKNGEWTHAWIEHLGLVLGVELGAHEVRVVLDLEDLHALAGLILSDKVQTSSLQLLNVRRVDLVAVAVPLLDLGETAVKGSDLSPLAVGLEDGFPGAETHGAAHVFLVELGHGDDHAVAGGGIKLLGVGRGQVADVAGILNGSGLEAKTDLDGKLALSPVS